MLQFPYSDKGKPVVLRPLNIVLLLANCHNYRNSLRQNNFLIETGIYKKCFAKKGVFLESFCICELQSIHSGLRRVCAVVGYGSYYPEVFARKSRGKKPAN